MHKYTVTSSSGPWAPLYVSPSHAGAFARMWGLWYGGRFF